MMENIVSSSGPEKRPVSERRLGYESGVEMCVRESLGVRWSVCVWADDYHVFFMLSC